MSFTERNKNGIIFMSADTISARHGFSTRFGGVSSGIYSSMNLRTSCRDREENVRENYRRLGEATGIDTGHMAFTRQVHKTDVRIATLEDVHTLYTDVPYEADGLVTNIPGLALICFTADCVPVLLHDPVHGVIAAVHCGWRSSVGDILGKTLEKMCALGAERHCVCAAIGPAISYCCFQVGGEVIDAAREYLGGNIEGLYHPDEKAPGKFLLDLKGCNARRLVQLGLREENIAVSDECTKCSHEKYWSHRHTGGERGTQGALIVLDRKD